MSKRKRGFLERLRFKYKIYIINENTLEERFHLRLSRLSVFLYAGVFAFISFVLFSLLLLYTPIKHLIPGYADVSVRSDLINETLRVDSLTNYIDLQTKQMDLFKNAILDKMPVDSASDKKDTLVVTDWKKLKLDAGEEEQKFRKDYEDNEKYNLGVIDQPEASNNNNTLVFYKPTSQGVITQSFGKDNNLHGITIVAAPQSAVSAVLEGTIINSDYTINSGNTITIQHLNGFVSIYKNTGKLLKEAGDHVRAGEAIALVGNNKDSDEGSKFEFELWQSGTPVNPEEYIDF